MIYEKLLQLQQKNIVVKKVGENPHFRSSYATLNEVLEKVKKPLNDLKVLILQLPEKDGLKTILYDTEDKSQVECFMPYVESTTAQKLGSNNTYNRRYSLVTILGLEDEDDDGNVASETHQKPQGSTVGGQNVPHGKTENYSQPGGFKPASLKQKQFISKLRSERGEDMPNEAWFEELDMATAKAEIDRLLKTSYDNSNEHD